MSNQLNEMVGADLQQSLFQNENGLLVPDPPSMEIYVSISYWLGFEVLI